MFDGLSTELLGAAIYDLGRSMLNRLTQNEWVQRFLTKYDLKGAQHDFAARYLEALVELHLQHKPTEVLNFFRESSISRTFYNFYYGAEASRGNEAQVQQELEHWVAALQVGDALKAAQLNPLAEAQAFWQIFRQKVQESRTVKEVEATQQIQELQHSFGDLISMLQAFITWMKANHKEHLQIADKIYNIEHIDQAFFSDRLLHRIPRFLTPLPFQAELFLGREADLDKIYSTLFESDHKLLLLVNGEGGIGKTALASKYFERYQDKYAHVAWVLKGNNFVESLLVLAIPLRVHFDEKWDRHQRLDVLITAMAALPKPCLLVIDNANELSDLRQYLPYLQRCSNFHLLFTTRIAEFPQVTSYKIEPLPQHLALQAFKAHYPAFEPQEEALFYEIYTAVQGNTLVLELLAKNLCNFNNKLKKNYLLADLRHDLEQGLLQLSKTSAVDVRYQTQGTGLRHEKIEVIIAAMYDLGDLSPSETQVLSIFAVLPAESIPFERLEELSLGLDGLDTTLLDLAQNGWLEYNDEAATFKCSPVIQEVVRLKNGNLLEDCRGLIDGLVDKLKYEGAIGHLLNVTYTEAILWARWAAALVAAPLGADDSIGLLCERLGTYHQTTGNLSQALTFFEKYNALTKELHRAYPKNLDFKNLLAISYSKLGSMHTALGNLPQALTFFEQYTSIAKELHTAYPENVSFKNGLALSYQWLGRFLEQKMQNSEKAQEHYQSSRALLEELVASFPDYVQFQKNLDWVKAQLGD